MNIESLLKQACWIWPGLLHEDKRNVYADFRYDFRIKRNKGRARLAITADQSYMLYVNGDYIGRGPARGYQWSWPYDEYDLIRCVRPGHNWISVRVYNAGCGTFQYLHQGACGMICAGEICGERILSGEGWIGQVSAANRRNTARLSNQLNYQEWMDARIDDQAWIRNAKHPLKQSGSIPRRSYGVMPWHSLEKRDIPNLGREELSYQCVIAAGNGGPCDSAYKDDKNLTVPWHREIKRIAWKEKEETADKWVPLETAGQGRFQIVVLDMGRPTIGTLLADVKGGKGGEILDFFFCEVVSRNGVPVIHDPTRGCAVSMSARLILRRGRTRHEFYQMVGHRYVTVIARDTLKPLRIKLKLRETVYPMQMKGNFKCGDEVLNKIYNICVRTQRVCALDSYVDTPWREQAQWWGDARVQAQNTFHISGDTRLLLRGIRSIARQEVPNGLTYGHAPTVAHNCILPDFSLIWVLTIWDYYYQTGDIRPFVEQWPRIKRLLGYFQGEGKSRNGLLRYDRRYWLFLDWSDLPKEGNPALLNLWYAMALAKTAKLAGLAGMFREKAGIEREHRAFCRKVTAAFWNEDKGMFSDGLTEKGERMEKYSIHTQTLAVLCGLRPARQREMMERCLLPYLRGEDIPGSEPSSYWVTYVYEVMKRQGYGAEVVRHIRRHWSPMIPYGGTWEVFKMQLGIYSVTHAWAAHPLYHLTGILGGIMQNAVAWKEIIFMPVIIPEYGPVNTVVPTPCGNVKSEWCVQGNKARVTLDLPRGVRAQARLSGLCECVTGQKQWEIKLTHIQAPGAVKRT